MYGLTDKERKAIRQVKKDDDAFSVAYEQALDDLHSNLLECLKNDGDFYTTLQEGIVRDINGFHFQIDNTAVNEIIDDVAKEFRENKWKQ